MQRKIKILVVDKRSNLRVVSIVRTNLKNYVPVSRLGIRGKLIYIKGEKVVKTKPAMRKRKVAISKKRAKRRETILRIKGVTLDLNKIKADEKRLLKKVKLMPTIQRGEFARRINPKGVIITNERDYESFGELQDNKRKIYLSIMDKLVKEKNPKFLDRMYELRDKLLRDGMVVEIDLYGSLNKKSNRALYLGTINVTGLMIEEMGIVEEVIIGASGYLHELTPIVDNAVRGKGGDGARLVRNNTTNANVQITNVKLRFNYA